MTRARALPALLLLAAGCSSLGESGTVVALEVRTPVPAAVEQNDTLTLRAVARDQDGDSVAATITWASADTTLVIVGADQLTTSLATGTGRVQARVGSLRSELVTYTIRRRSDSLVLVGPAVDTVDVALETASAVLDARLESHGDDTVGVSGATIRYRVIDADTALARNTVEFPGGGLERRATTGANGSPTTGVTLGIVAGATPPDSVRIEILAERPSGTVVPGSGQQFTVVFE
jgi:hypothetical protein